MGDGSDGDAQVWVVVRSEAGREDLGLPGTLTRLRELSADEAARTFTAIDLFQSFGEGWSHHEVVLASRQIIQTVEASSPEALDGEAVSWLVRQLAAAALGRVDCADAGLARREAIDAALAAPSGQVLAKLVARPWELDVVAIEDRHAIEIVFDDGPRERLELWMQALTASTREIADGELLDVAEDLVEGAMALAACHAIVGWGHVGLALRTDLDGPPPVPLRGLPFDLVDPVMSFLRIARGRRDGIALFDDETTGAPSPVSSDDPDPDLAPAPEGAGGDAAASSDGLAAKADADEPDASPALPEATVVDMGSFLREVTARSTAMEARWSDALAETRGDDIEMVEGQVVAVTAALMAQIHLDEDKDDPVRLPGLPLQTETANALEVAAEGRTLREQRALATTLAFEDLMRAFGVLRSPTAGVVDPIAGTIRRFWSQHGFSRINHLSEQLVRIVTDASVTGDARRAAMASLAIEAWAIGMPEAAAVYVLGALDDTDASGPLADAYATLRRCGDLLATGAPVGLDVLVPLVRFWTDELRRRHAAGPPAASKTDDDGL